MSEARKIFRSDCRNKNASKDERVVELPEPDYDPFVNGPKSLKPNSDSLNLV